MLGPWPRRMVNPIRGYDWGSTTTLARMQGRAPTGTPEAELWMGAHPSAPSVLEDSSGVSIRLDEAIEANALSVLGSQVHDQFGARLPFLFKVLAIARPLSVQVHPTAERARKAFEGEAEVVGEHRYVDPFPKPEMLYALEPMDALSGFREAEDAAHLLGLLRIERLQPLIDGLNAQAHESHRLESTLAALVTWPADDRAALAVDISRACRRQLADADSLAPMQRRTLMWACRLAAEYPKDPMVAAPFLLELVRLEPGEVMYVPAGAPHAYLYGLGVEIMANSDNVLRAGLTHKSVAVDELLHIVDGDSRPFRDVPYTWLSPYEVAWLPPASQFQLSRLWMTDNAPVMAFPGIAGPQILLCTSGPVTVSCGPESVELHPGQSAFIGASGGAPTLRGPGEVFRASAGDQRLA